MCVGLTVADAVENGYDEYFDKMVSYLKKDLGHKYSPEGDPTNVAIKFEITHAGESIGVDLILSPYFASQHDLLTALKRVRREDRLKM